MRTRNLLIATILGAAAAPLAWSSVAAPGAPQVPTWEYKVEVCGSAFEHFGEILGASQDAESEEREGEEKGLISGFLKRARDVEVKQAGELEARLSALGSEGWELVLRNDGVLIFKRPGRG